MRTYSLVISSLLTLVLAGAGCDSGKNPVDEGQSQNNNVEQVSEHSVSEPIVENNQTENSVVQKKYTVYSGAYFDIEYPEQFSVEERVLDESMTDKYAEVVFVSPNEDAEFVVFSPLWSGVAEYETITDLEEVVAEQENSTTDGFTTTTTKWITVEAKDGSYARSMRIITTNDETVRYLFGVTYKSQEALDEYREEYNHFTTSLVQYADA